MKGQKNMTDINKDTANWRLFGGGGLLVGGLLWVISAVLPMIGDGNATDLTTWLGRIGLIVVALGLVLVSTGQTGSNGAVGNHQVGKLALWAAALGFLLWAVVVDIFKVESEVLNWIVGVLIVVGTVVAAVVIKQKGVARGLAAWAMFLVAIAAVLYFLGTLLGVQGLAGATAGTAASWVGLAFAIVTALTGLLYLLNKKS